MAFPRVLIVAEHASAKFGGEAFLPLHYFRLLRKRGVEAYLLCHSRVRDELRATFPNEVSRMYFVEDMPVQRGLCKAGDWLPKGFGAAIVGPLINMATQRAARTMARQIVRDEHIDVVHQPTPVSPKLPSAIWGVGAPVIIGPMNGGMTYPPGFLRRQRGGELQMVAVARLAANLANRAIPGKRRAALLLVANQRTRDALSVSAPVKEMVENGVDLERFAASPRHARSEPPRFAFVGRLVDWKAVDILIEAFARARRVRPMWLELFGDGPELGSLKQLVDKLGLSEAVAFHGFVPQAELPARLTRCDALVLPSLRECGGAVVLEAMALGLPIIATRWGGPADYLDERCGILVEPRSPEQLIHDIMEAMVRLAGEEAVRLSLGEAGRRKVEREFDWEKKLDQMLAIYDDVISRKQVSGQTNRRAP
jgi:glycosyltransferase involved in cell wall biosynthesis